MIDQEATERSRCIDVLWIHEYWVDGPVDASHELMEYELGRRASNDLLHNDLVLFGVFV